MEDFAGKHLVLGVGGGVAAYRACDWLRSLQRMGVSKISPILTPAAERFVSPLTLSSLAKQPASSDVWAVNEAGIPLHIALAQQGDALLIVSATASLLARLAHGLADDLLTTTALTFTDKPLLLAPAMNSRMWANPATQANVALLKSRPNIHFIEPREGLLACGETGTGHLADEALMVQALRRVWHPQQGLLLGLRVLVTAGGTQEALDPVRCLSNHSSGKMGLAFADELDAMGAEVTLLCAHMHLPGTAGLREDGLPLRSYQVLSTPTVASMQAALHSLQTQQDWIIKVAAVSDFQAAEAATDKLKKEASPSLHLHLKQTPDLLKELAERRANTPALARQKLLGFAAETQACPEQAQRKLTAKGIDALVLNAVNQSGTGFGADDNEGTLFFACGKQVPLARKNKQAIAREVVLACAEQFGWGPGHAQ
jgi:phosphopantothenoylcysteine decarboxylase/phosphopantothenate--cysteine ligase